MSKVRCASPGCRHRNCTYTSRILKPTNISWNESSHRNTVKHCNPNGENVVEAPVNERKRESHVCSLFFLPPALTISPNRENVTRSPHSVKKKTLIYDNSWKKKTWLLFFIFHYLKPNVILNNDYKYKTVEIFEASLSRVILILIINTAEGLHTESFV